MSDSTFLNNLGGGLDHFSGFTPQTDRLDVTGSLFVGNTRDNGFGGAVYNGGAATITGQHVPRERDHRRLLPAGRRRRAGLGRVGLGRREHLRGQPPKNPDAWLARGGGLFVEDIQHVSVTGSTFRDNLARGTNANGGGASRSVVYGSYFQPQDTTFSGDTFLENRAVSDRLGRRGRRVEPRGRAGDDDDLRFALLRQSGDRRGPGDELRGAYARGGGIEADGPYGPASTLAISGTDFVDNAALAGRGPSGGFAEGGALILGGFSSTAITGGSFANNAAVGGAATAPQSGGFSGLAYGGAIREFSGGGPLAVTGTSFVGNSALGGAAAPGGDGGIASGGAFVGDGDFTDVTFNKNEAIGGAGGGGHQRGHGRPGRRRPGRRGRRLRDVPERPLPPQLGPRRRRGIGRGDRLRRPRRIGLRGRPLQRLRPGDGPRQPLQPGRGDRRRGRIGPDRGRRRRGLRRGDRRPGRAAHAGQEDEVQQEPRSTAGDDVYAPPSP